MCTGFGKLIYKSETQFYADVTVGDFATTHGNKLWWRDEDGDDYEDGSDDDGAVVMMMMMMMMKVNAEMLRQI